jgi:mRNA-degrading endonuclease toxin of MazEF toxin-antitoxin module
MTRGDVVIANFPFQDVPGAKVRPALVVQNNSDNAALPNTILAMITGNLADAGRPTNLLVDPTSAEGAGSGLRGPSLVKCENLALSGSFGSSARSAGSRTYSCGKWTTV